MPTFQIFITRWSIYRPKKGEKWTDKWTISRDIYLYRVHRGANIWYVYTLVVYKQII